MSARFTVEEEVATVNFGRPHVVILGAGASRAAFPRGDRDGRSLPVMADFVETAGLQDTLEDARIAPPHDDFERIYASLCDDPRRDDLRQAIEERVQDYFRSLDLPEHPTLYDRLILSLRPKDVVATFNWDPFLWQAADRNWDFAAQPRLLFLHGNVAIGVCNSCRVVGSAGGECVKCASPLLPCPLLYPITHKNYSADPYIASAWEVLKAALSHAYILTIFGYAAPASDVDAVDLMSMAWGSPESRNLEEVELIDIVDAETLGVRWERFIHSHHYRTCTSFDESLLGRHPRRTCEALWATLMDVKWPEGTVTPTASNFDELYEFYEPRVSAEPDE